MRESFLETSALLLGVESAATSPPVESSGREGRTKTATENEHSIEEYYSKVAQIKCPKCGSTDVKAFGGEGGHTIICQDCGYHWKHKSAVVQPGMQQCPDCEGKGFRNIPIYGDQDEIEEWTEHPCDMCGGTGQVDPEWVAEQRGLYGPNWRDSHKHALSLHAEPHVDDYVRTRDGREGTVVDILRDDDTKLFVNFDPTGEVHAQRHEEAIPKRDLEVIFRNAAYNGDTCLCGGKLAHGQRPCPHCGMTDPWVDLDESEKWPLPMELAPHFASSKTAMMTCPNCHGTGEYSIPWGTEASKCKRCNGTGEIDSNPSVAKTAGSEAFKGKCERCAGKGWIDLGGDLDFVPHDNTCPECKGTGELQPGQNPDWWQRPLGVGASKLDTCIKCGGHNIDCQWRDVAQAYDCTCRDCKTQYRTARKGASVKQADALLEIKDHVRKFAVGDPPYNEGFVQRQRAYVKLPPVTEEVIAAAQAVAEKAWNAGAAYHEAFEAGRSFLLNGDDRYVRKNRYHWRTRKPPWESNKGASVKQAFDEKAKCPKCGTHGDYANEEGTKLEEKPGAISPPLSWSGKLVCPKDGTVWEYTSAEDREEEVRQFNRTHAKTGAMEDSLVNEKMRPADTRVILQQLGITRMSLGMRDVVDLGDGMMCRIGIGRPVYKLCVKLNWMDEYDVEIGHIRGDFDWDVDYRTSNIDAGNLAEVVEDAWNEVMTKHRGASVIAAGEWKVIVEALGSAPEIIPANTEAQAFRYADEHNVSGQSISIKFPDGRTQKWPIGEQPARAASIYGGDPEVAAFRALHFGNWGFEFTTPGARCPVCGAVVAANEDAVLDHVTSKNHTSEEIRGGLPPPTSRTAAEDVTEDWLRERNNDPYGTPPKHEFWNTVEVEQVGSYKIFEKDGKAYAYDTKYNSWWRFPSREDAVRHAEGGSIDVWSKKLATDPEMQSLFKHMQDQIPGIQEAEKADTLPCPQHGDDSEYLGSYASFPGPHSEYKCPQGHTFKVKPGTTREQIEEHRKQGGLITCPKCNKSTIEWDETNGAWKCTNCGYSEQGSKTSARYRSTLEFWAPDDIDAYHALDAVRIAVTDSTTPYPDYVAESGIATGEVDVSDPDLVMPTMSRSQAEIAARMGKSSGIRGKDDVRGEMRHTASHIMNATPAEIPALVDQWENDGQWFDPHNAQESIEERNESGKALSRRIASALTGGISDIEFVTLHEAKESIDFQLGELEAVAPEYQDFDEKEYLDNLPGGTVAREYDRLIEGGLVDLGPDDGSLLYAAAKEVQDEARSYDWEAFISTGAEQWVIDQMVRSPDMLRHQDDTRDAAIEYAKNKSMVLMDGTKRAHIIDGFVNSAERFRRAAAQRLEAQNGHQREASIRGNKIDGQVQEILNDAGSLFL